jgi:ribonuclease HI
MRSPISQRPQSQKQSDSLFSEVKGTRPESYLVAHTDGGARGNPGPAGYGVVLEDQSGHRIATLSKYLGHQTNNYAEYSALIAALEYAVQHGHRALKVISDSELLVRQIRGAYKVKHPALQELYRRARALIGQLDWFDIQHVLRGKNREADRLANEAMDKGTGRTQSEPTPGPSRSDEMNGIVRGGVIELLSGELPEGTVVTVRVKR